MKSTLLACAAQLKLSEEHRMLQGHHRSSARLYSRNDTFGSMHLQRCITEAVCSGFRPQRSMARGAQAPLPEPAFSLDSAWPTELLSPLCMTAGPWKAFISRHEELQSGLSATSSGHATLDSNAGTAADSSSATHTAQVIADASDSEAEAVRIWAHQHASSDEDEMQAVPCTADLSDPEEEELQLRVCNGPWSSLHKPTQASAHAFLESNSADFFLINQHAGASSASLQCTCGRLTCTMPVLARAALERTRFSCLALQTQSLLHAFPC